MGELHLFIVWSGKRAMIWPGVKWTAKTFCGCYSEHNRSFRQTETRKHSLPLLCFIHRMIEKTVSHQSELRAPIQSPAWTGLWLLYLAYVAVGLETSRHLYSMGLAVLETVLVCFTTFTWVNLHVHVFEYGGLQRIHGSNEVCNITNSYSNFNWEKSDFHVTILQIIFV